MQRVLLATMTLMMTACGLGGTIPWDKNRDGVVGPCEGLNPYACQATPGCVRTAALAVCTGPARADGGCATLPEESCQPIPTRDCGSLTIAQCSTMPHCEVVALDESAPREASDQADPALGAPEIRRPTPRPLQVCVNRAPPNRCESLDVAVCLSRPGCSLENYGAVCEIACDLSDPNSCPPCAIPQQRCVTTPPPDVCANRDVNQCGNDGRCVLEAWACPAVCIDDGNGGCLPCETPAPRCVPAPDVCSNRSPSQCESDGRCVAEDAYCARLCVNYADGIGCSPCPTRCVPRPQDDCPNRPLNHCEGDGRCQVESWDCAQVCIDDGDGGCLPCNAPPDRCVAVP